MRLRGAADQLLGLAKIEQRGDSPALPVLHQAQRFAPRVESALRDLQLVVELQQAEIVGGDIADERGDDGFAILFGIQQTGARGFGRAAEASPEIDFEGQQIQRRLSPVAILARHERRRAAAAGRRARGA